MSRILVIIVTFNGMKWIEKCLRSVSQSSIPVDVVVIDNCSTDGTASFVKETFPEINLIRSERNLGFGQGNNIGLKLALERGYDYVYLLNQDAYLGKDTIEVMAEVFKKSKAMGERFGILSPLQRNVAGGPLDRKFARRYNQTRETTPSGIHRMRFVNAAHWMISRECLEEVGGFSPVFNQYGEDNNFVHRARYFGWKVGAVVGADAIHDRDCTKISREKGIRIKTIMKIVKLSNPGKNFTFMKITQPLSLLGLGIICRSLYPIKYLPEMIRRYPEISSRRKESQNKGAFL